MCQTLFYSAKKAARLLGVTLGDVFQLCDNGELDSCHSGAVRLIPVKSFEAYAASLRERSA